MQKTLVTCSLTLMLKVKVPDITKRLRNVRDWKNKKSHANCLITYMLKGLLFTTEDMKKKDKAQVPQQNEMLSIYCIVLDFKQNISKSEDYNLENNI